jgi:hypothetical protein
MSSDEAKKTLIDALASKDPAQIKASLAAFTNDFDEFPRITFIRALHNAIVTDDTELFDAILSVYPVRAVQSAVISSTILSDRFEMFERLLRNAPRSKCGIDSDGEISAFRTIFSVSDEKYLRAFLKWRAEVDTPANEGWIHYETYPVKMTNSPAMIKIIMEAMSADTARAKARLAAVAENKGNAGPSLPTPC